MMKNLKNPVLRNILAIIAVLAALAALGVIATLGDSVVDWVLSLGWPIWITIIVTALVCGIVFGILEMRSGKKSKKRYDEN